MKSINIQKVVFLGSWEKQEYERFIYTPETSTLNIQTFMMWSLIADGFKFWESDKLRNKWKF